MCVCVEIAGLTTTLGVRRLCAATRTITWPRSEARAAC